ncbi:MAG TPA: sulfatase-like hydrolase/transferase [Terriglobales bacterium]|nr:sulfatase-like hydrolase/transferase [Terriglobales bacterium]
MISCRRSIFLASLLISVSSAYADPIAPDVVVITIDTLRADHLGCYGYKQIHTPNLDALAADGIRFERAYTPVPVTLPSHTVIFTGTYPTFSGMHDFSGNKLSPTQPTLASVLKNQGYATGAVIGSAVLDSRFGLNHGFDFYYDHFDFSRLDESNLDAMERPGNLVADQALAWLQQNYQKKFFLWMHLYDPHYPYRPPAPYSEQYKDHPYDGEIAFADEQVGRLIRFLKDKGLYRNTLIVLSGDHGESLGEHGEKTHGFFIYNATLHVPVIIHLPGPASAKTVSELASTADLMPTILHALNIAVPGQVQGRNLLPLIEAKREEGDTSLYAETFLPRLHFNWSELRGAETDRYHFIDAPKPELYDLSKDPGETQNLYSQKPAVAQEMRAKLTALISQYGVAEESAEKTGLDPALMERLKSLGYAGFSGGGSSSAAVSGHNLPDPKDRIQTYELISDAVAQSQHGEFKESVENLKTGLKTDPDSVPIHYLLGLNYYRLGEFPTAVEEFQKVLKLSPDYSLATFQLGNAYAKSGDFDDAISALKQTLHLDPTNFSAAYNLGAAYLQKKMIPDATQAFRQSVEINPDFGPAHGALGEVLFYQGRVDEAITELRRATELVPDVAGFHAYLAKALQAKGMDAAAAEEMRRAQPTRPQ